jgi:small-conductance mechanosensitive channel
VPSLGTVGRVERQQLPQRKASNRPLQAIIMLVLAAAAAATVHWAGLPLDIKTASDAAKLNTVVSVTTGHVIQVCGAIAFCVFGLIFTFAIARWTRAALEPLLGVAYGTIIRYVIILIGIAVIALTALAMLNFRIQQLVLGGAITGVLISIAAQQSLANLFAGVMLQFARPFRVGDRVRIRAGALSGTIEGTVTEFSITYVHLQTDDGPVFLPNAQVLAAAVSPLPPSTEPQAAADGTGAAVGAASGCDR